MAQKNPKKKGRPPYRPERPPEFQLWGDVRANSDAGRRLRQDLRDTATCTECGTKLEHGMSRRYVPWKTSFGKPPGPWILNLVCTQCAWQRATRDLRAKAEGRGIK